MSIRNKKLDRRYRVMERRSSMELLEAMTDSLFEAFRAGRLISVRAIAMPTFHWPAPPGER